MSYSAARHQARDGCPVCGRTLTEQHDVSEEQVRDYLYRPSASRSSGSELKNPE